MSGVGARLARRVAIPGPVLGLVLALGACAVAPPAATDEATREPVEVRSAVDREAATTGDLITWTVTVDHEDGLEVGAPQWETIEGLEVVDRGEAPERSRNGRTIEESWVLLRADLVGSYRLPEVTVEYLEDVDDDRRQATASAPEVPIEVESVLPADAEPNDIRDLKPIRRVRIQDWRWWAAGGALALLLAALGWWGWRRFRRPRPEAPPIPPERLALERLERLTVPDGDDRRAVRRYYFAISAIVREYVEGRFGLNATDLTTEEILGHLEGLVELDSPEAELLADFLTTTDAVRYAGERPPADEPQRLRETAVDFVHRTPPRDDSEEEDEASLAAGSAVADAEEAA